MFAHTYVYTYMFLCNSLKFQKSQWFGSYIGTYNVRTCMHDICHLRTSYKVTTTLIERLIFAGEHLESLSPERPGGDLASRSS